MKQKFNNDWRRVFDFPISWYVEGDVFNLRGFMKKHHLRSMNDVLVKWGPDGVALFNKITDYYTMNTTLINFNKVKSTAVVNDCTFAMKKLHEFIWNAPKYDLIKNVYGDMEQNDQDHLERLLKRSNYDINKFMTLLDDGLQFKLFRYILTVYSIEKQ